MTEAQWLASRNPEKMLAHPAGHASDRKLRLFAAACCRRSWGTLVDERSRDAIACIERLADACISPSEGEAARQRAMAARTNLQGEQLWAAEAVVRAFLGRVAEAAEGVVRAVHAFGLPREVLKLEMAARAVFLRDILGNPFRDVTLSPLALTPAVTSLAQATYEHRQLPSGYLDREHLGVLADALEESGCDSAIVSHLRSPEDHIRGCWVVDLVVAKE